MESKACSKCSIIKSLDMFHTKKTAYDGRRSKCKQCHAIMIRSRNNPRQSYGNIHCGRCRELKDVSEFGCDKARGNGLQSWCKICRKIKRPV